MAVNDARSEKEGDGGPGRRANWRGSGSATTSPAAGYRWRDAGEKTNREVAQQNLRRRVKLTVLSCIVLGLCGAFAWHWLMRPRATPLLAVTLTQYTAPLPPNSLAAEDATRLADAAKTASGGSGMLSVKLSPATADGTDDERTAWNDKPADALVKQLVQWLEGVTAGGPGRGLLGRGGAVVIYISGHGIVDEQGRACIIPADAASRGDVGEPPYAKSARWLAVAELVKRLDEIRPSVKKLLALDCGRLDENWAAGLLYNGFSEALTAAVGNARSVAILNSAAARQLACPAPELQGTPFGFYLAQALIGDPAADDNRNGKISLQEVARFVRARVSNWVRANRYDEQLPLLVPADADFDVVYKDLGASDAVRPPGADKIEAELNELQPLLSQLDELWLEHAAMQESADVEMPAVWSEHGLDWHRFQQELVRCGSLILAGRGYRDDCAACLAQLKSRAQTLNQRRHAELPVHSLPLARRWNKLATDSSLRDEAADYLRGEKKDTSSKLHDDYLPRAEGAYQWLIEGRALAGPEGRDAARRAMEFVGSPGAGKAELVEVRLLRLLADDAPDSAFNQSDKQLLPVLKLRETAEEAAAPLDVRVHYALRRPIDAADADLRRLENALFLNDEAWKKAEPALAREQAYQSAARDGDRLAEILSKRDRAWADLPYLAQWTLRRPDTPDDRPRQPADRITEVVRQLQDLDVRLHALLERDSGSDVTAAAREETLEELQLDSDKIERWRSGTQMSLQDEVDRAVVRARDEVTLRQTVSLLANPLVSGRKRIALRKQFLDALQRPSAVAGSSPSVVAQTGDDDAYLTQLASGDHPAVAFAGATSEAVSAAKPGGKQAVEPAWMRLARQGGEVRRALLNFFSAPATPKVSDDDEKPAPARSVYSAAERRMRSAAALFAAADLGANDPIDRLARFDLNEFLAWRGERALADFWGSGDWHSGDGGGSTRPYFALTFDELREAARKLSPADSVAGGEMQARWASLKEKEQRLLAAVEKSAIAAGGNDLSRAPGTTFQRKVPLRLAADLPAGDAALFVLDADRQAAPIRLLSFGTRDFQSRLPLTTVSRPATQSDLALEIRRGKTAGESPDARPWTVVWFYRGHHKTQPFNVVAQREGIQVVYERRATPVETTVTVTGDDLKEASIVFILDCSASMATRAAGGARRMDVARAALGNIIEDLSRTQRLRVGLWLYGHRLGRRQTGGPIEASPDWPPPPANLRIGNDVDEVLPLVVLDNSVKREFLDRLARARPWGETPLYLSMVEAMRPFHWPAGAGARHLVVITDGKNEVTDQSPRVVGNQVVEALQADRRSRGQQALKLHVLDCTLGENDELRKLLTSNGLGDYIAVDEWPKLERTLKEALGLAEYELRSLDARDGRTLGPEPLGRPIVVPGPFLPELPRAFEVRVVDRPALKAKLKLEGEEALRLLASRRGTREQLVFERYEPQGSSLADQSLARNVPNVLPPGTADDDTRPASFDIAAYPPQWEGGATRAKRPARFTLSIQDGGDPPGFSPRPAEAWVEIAPRANGEAMPPYPFYDRLFEEERPVPVLLCRVPEWPVAAREAEIRLWFKLEPTRPTKEMVIGKVETPADETQEMVLPGMPAMRLGVQTADEGDGGRLTVAEEHPPGDAAVVWLRIETLEPPDRVVRTFSYSGRSATHEFYFRGRPRSSLIHDRLLITTQSDLRRDSVAIDKTPLRVTLE